MPAAYDYYSKRSRKLSTSQMSLPDQLQDPSNIPTSNSTTFLPSTTYARPNSPPTDPSDVTLSPDSFYRQYHSQYAQQGAPLRQGAIKTTDIDLTNQPPNGRSASFASVSSLEERRAAYENGHLAVQDTGRSHTVSPGLRGRKASVRNLVAQINATANEEVPPLPTQPVSRNASRNVSPVLLSNVQFQPTVASRNHLDHVHSQSNSYHEMNGRVHVPNGENGLGIGSPEMVSYGRRPLFGEVVPGLPVATVAGYGIQNFRKRSGSEGSPLVTAPRFTLARQKTVEPEPGHDSAVSESDPNFTLAATTYKIPNGQPVHRRANSENPLTPNKETANTVTRHLQHADNPAKSQTRKRASSSRIPVSVHDASGSADVDGRTAQNHSGSRSRQRSLPQIQSPGQRGKKAAAHQAPQGAKSPSLHANIIVPPPKISPPLRSSRPRVPVSSASTAASRARMAEKFSNMQKINDEKRRASRRAARPPELTDVDLKARRLRITQALSRSLEGQDLKGNTPLAKQRDLSRSRTASPTPSDRSRHTEPFETRSNNIPAVVIDTAAGPGHTQPDQDTPQDGPPRESILFAQNALDAMQGSSFRADEDDSPVAGPVVVNRDGRLAALETNIQHVDRNQEPWSALTDATENTTIDPEPQDDQRGEATRSILSQIQDMRGGDSMRQPSYETFSDRGDQESVQLILRDTLYLDDDEAVRKGYRPAPAFTDPLMESPEIEHNPRSSWISSMDESDDQEGSSPEQALHNTAGHVAQENSQSYLSPDHSHDHENEVRKSARSTMASEAYTIVNIVLQQHSYSGLIDQQFVDDVYQRVLEDSPYNEENLNQERIEQVCLREIRDREESWYKPSEDGEPQSPVSIKTEEDIRTPTKQKDTVEEPQQDQNNWLYQTNGSSSLAPPPAFKGHRYKSSLGSAEDWLDASPSISDWMRFQADDPARHSVDQKAKAESPPPDTSAVTDTQGQQDGTVDSQGEDPDLYAAPVPRAPSHSPPLPPDQIPSIEQTSFGTAIIERPSVLRRITSLSQMSRSSTRGRSTPNASVPTLGKASMDEPMSPEQRRLKQRRNVIKELVDTEFTYEKDLRVLCDIYKQTASAALVEEDIKVLFGNVEQVQEFSKDFLMLLKDLAKPTYRMERPERKKEHNVSRSSSIRPSSSSSTLASSVRNAESDLPTTERDQATRIGQAFEASLHDMEKVYTEYIKNRHAANLRLEIVQKSPSAREWLKECKDNSSDITNAWNLDALLVKPVQRITKYPLLLKELVDSTPEGHPDLSFLRRAMHEVTEVNMRINDVKKHAELVDQVLNRKRKDSDVRAGLSKAFGRRAEKLKQQVGMTEMYEDGEYNDIKIHYDNNIVQLMVVGNDCSSYGRAVTKWVNKMVEIAAAAEAWVDVGHSNHQEAESKLRQFAMVVRGISTIALPDHLEQLSSRVLGPMQQAVDAMTKFKTDPKGLLQKREKRMIDYAQIKTKKDRGERIDKKTSERMEQSEALNVEAKERMRKLIRSTGQLVQNCQASLIHMQMTWQGMVKQKLSAAMGISLDHLDVDDIEKEWQMNFDFEEASALTLGVCNGSLLAEAVNMVTYPSASTTLVNGQDSPRQGSFTSASKRSISMTSTNETYPPIPEYDPRTSGTTGFHFREPSLPFANNRTRAQSSTSSKHARTPDLSNPSNTHGSAGEGFGVSHFGRAQDNSAAPRLSVETPSPLIGLLQPEASCRPGSASTFFSATGTPPPQQHQSTGSSVFSSAMPMSDSPVTDRQPESNQPQDPEVLFTAASVYEFNIDRSRREAGFPYLTYVTGEIFDIIGERGELWLAKNQDDPQKQIGWIWNKHFAKLAE